MPSTGTTELDRIISMVPIIVLCFSMLMEIVWLPPKNPNSVVGF